MPRHPLSTKKSPLTVDVLYVADPNGNQVVTAASNEVVIAAPAQGLVQRGLSHYRQVRPLPEEDAADELNGEVNDRGCRPYTET